MVIRLRELLDGNYLRIIHHKREIMLMATQSSFINTSLWSKTLDY